MPTAWTDRSKKFHSDPFGSSPSGHASQPDFTDPNAAAAAYARLQRTLVASQEQVTELLEGKKRKAETIASMGRGVRKLVTLYESLQSLVNEADRRVTEQDEGLDMDPELIDPSIRRARDRTYRAYQLLLQSVPHVKKAICDPDPNVLKTFLADLQEGANSARSDDIKRIKEEVANWINQGFKPETILDTKSRAGRGRPHDICGSLLIPFDMDWSDPEVRADFRAGKLDTKDNYYLSCLYSKIRNKDRVEQNFLRGNLLLKSYCCIFTSPSSAETVDAEEEETGPSHKRPKTSSQKKATKSNVAMILNMDGTVTGRSIAYAAVLLVYNLTDAVQWNETHDNFNYVSFYNFIVDYFEERRSEASSRRVQALLKWWNRKVFPDHVGATSESTASRDRLLAAADDDYD